MELLTLKKFDTPQLLASGFAKDLAALVASDKNQEWHIALSGGSTPKLLFQILADNYSDDLPWSNIYFYWGDERCVPPDHIDSNYLMAKTLLLDHIDIPAANIHRIHGEAPSQEEARRYGKLLEDILPSKNGLPLFDLIILGMGEDGHTASIFPHQMEWMTLAQNCAVATHPDSGQQRITLSGPVINNADRVVFLITGAGKREVFSEIWQHRDHWQQYPTAHIAPRGELTYYVDRAVVELG